MILSIEEYNRLELEAKKTACYPAIRAFAPTSFLKVGFPHIVEDEGEIWRYADIMGEVGHRRAADRLYSRIEADVMLSAANRVRRIAGIDPWACLFGPATIWRGIAGIAEGRQLTVMDVGAGSGYLDVYLAWSGHKVLAVEVTQALYLWQNRFFDGIDNIRQIPWWEYAEMFKMPPKIDFLICDAALGEMDTWAMHYTLRLAKLMDVPVLFRHVGEPYNSNESSVWSYAQGVGTQMIHIGEDAPPIGGEATLRSTDFYIPAKLMPSYAFMDFIGIGS